MLPVYFSFDGYGARRHLHSFPTRRSSDLEAARSRPAQTARHHPVPREQDGMNKTIGQPCAGKPHARLEWRAWRSEEHTSELQSRRDLVCRLLLEKKKKITHPVRPLDPLQR